MAITAADLREAIKSPPQDPKARKELYTAAQQLVYELETAQDTAQRLYHGHVPLAMAQTGIDLNIYDLVSNNPDKKWSVQDLADTTLAEPQLLIRLLRCMASYGMLKENSDGTYSASNITHNLSIEGTPAGIKHYSMTMTPAYQAIPKFLAQEKYKNPTGKAPFNMAYNTDMPVFEWRKHNPENAKVGQAFMAAQRMGQKSVWDGKVPMDDFQLSEKDLEAQRPLFVDVGGGFGHQCIDVKKHNPGLKGRFITEDLPFVHGMIQNNKELKDLGIETQQHDFMKEQPIKNGKIYYLRNVIHNWNDEPSKVILGQIRKAMAPDSIVIIDDVVLPKVGTSWKQASMDIAMMTMLAAVERTEEHFKQLLKEVDLKIREIWTYDEEYGDSFIVAVPL